MYNKMKITCPIYFEDFKCIGGECEDTCCKGWDIEIDKDTFGDYCSIENKEMQEMVEKSIFRNEECTSDDLDYGIIKLNEQKICPFLDENGYCSIYSKIGEEYLSNICTHFPRILNKIDNKYEISLDIACIEAAKLILKEKGKMKFVSSEKEFDKYIINDEYNTNSKKLKNSPIKYFKEIRKYSIEIMQNRDFDISQRFYILGDFIFNLQKIAEDNCSMIPDFIKEYDINKAGQQYERSDINYIFQILFFKNIVDSSKISEKAISSAFKKYTEEIFKGLDLEKVDDLKKNAESYMKAFDEYEKEVIKNNSYIFENYLVNFMYGNLFPFSESDFMFEGYIMLLVRYSFIRFYLVGTYINSRKEAVDEDDIIKFMMVFARTIEHDKNYLPKVLEYIQENKYDNMKFAERIL